MTPKVSLLKALLAYSLLCSSLVFATTEASDASAHPSRGLLQSPPIPPDDSIKPFSWSWRTGIMLAITFLVSALSMPAGIGGGLIFVPLLNTLLDFSPRASSAEAQSFILGGALGSAWITLASRHPSHPERPLIDFQVLLLLLPLMLVGVCAGVLLNNSFPNWLITFLLLIVILYQGWASAAKTLKLHRAHQKIKQAQAQAQERGPGQAGVSMVQQPTERAEQAQQAQQALELTGQQDTPRGRGTVSSGRAALGPAVPLAASSPTHSSMLRRLSSGFSQALQAGSYPEVPSLSPGWMGLEAEVRTKGAEARRVEVQVGRAHTSSEPLLHCPSRGLSAAEEGQQCGVGCPAGASAAPAAAQRASSAPVGVGLAAGGQQGGLAWAAPESAQLQAGAAAAAAAVQAGAAAGWELGAGPLSASSSRALPAFPSVEGQLRIPTCAPAAAGSPEGLLVACRSGATATRGAGVCSQGGSAIEQPAVGNSGGAAATSGGWAGAEGSQGPALPRPASLSALAGLASQALRQAASDVLRLPRFERATLRQLAAVGGIWGGFVAFQAARGGTSHSRGTQCFAANYVMITLEFVLLLGAAAGYTAHIVRTRRRVDGTSSLASAATAEAGEGPGHKGRQGEGQLKGREEEGPWIWPKEEGEKEEGQLNWSLKKIITVQTIAAFGGTLATMLGLGGGLVMGPLLLALDIHPLVASATSSFMVLLSVSAATITYAIQSQLELKYSLIYGASCLVGALLGVLGVNRVVRATGATWLVVGLMTVVVGAGAVIVAAISMPRAVQDLVNGRDVGFTSLCGH